ncbi:MAG: hypothetical protein LQ347_002675 [Umbilicaria vellea]|nr:MAG: hypothetical protein LQ347_002675 [Umbilicaria vellea]
MSAGVRTLPTELGIITEDPVIDRKLSCSPEPIDPGSPAESAQMPAQMPGQHWRPPGTASTASRAGAGRNNMPAGTDFDVGIPQQDSSAAYHAFIKGGKGPFGRKNTSEGSPIFQRPPRQFTEITNASLPFDETEAWDKKAILSLGRHLAPVGPHIGLIDFFA